MAYGAPGRPKDFGIRTLSTVGLDRKVGNDGAAWIDRGLVAKDHSLEEKPKHINALAAYCAMDAKVKREHGDPISVFKSTFLGSSFFRSMIISPATDHMRRIKNLFDNIVVMNFWGSAYFDALMKIIDWRNAEALLGKAAA